MRRFRLLIADEGVKAHRGCDKLAKTQRHGRGSNMANMLDMISAKEAKQLVAEADPEREMAANDTLSQTALHWAMKNAIGRTDSRIRTYAKFGRTQLSVKFAPSDIDHDGEGNSFYNDLLGNSNSYVADAISDIIYGREQTMISPIQTARLLGADRQVRPRPRAPRLPRLRGRVRRQGQRKDGRLHHHHQLGVAPRGK